MSAKSEEYNLNTFIKVVAQKCELTEWQYVLQNFDSIGQNYFGVLIPLVLTGNHKEGEPVRIPLVLKLAPTDKRFRLSDAVTRMFNREIFIYNVVLKKYHKIQEGIKLPHYVIPKCYYISNEYCHETLVMQDMCEEGYTPYCNNPFLDLNHILISVNALAKLHALSFILRKTDRKVYNDVKEQCVPLSEKTDKRYLEVLTDRLNKALDKFANTKYVSLLEVLKQNCGNYILKTAESVHEICICHGDIWKENILFKYEKSKPIEACLIDYQTTRMCSPAFDLLYLIMSSTSIELRQQHFKQIVDSYYSTLNIFLSAVGLQSEEIYSMEALINDLRVVGPACLIVANTALWLSNGLQQEGHVRSKLVLTSEEELATATEKYKSIVKGIMDDLSSYGYLCI